MADISSFLKKILSAIYGEEVRGSIHDALSAMNTESSSAMEFASTAKGDVYLKTPDGDVLNLKSKLCQFVSMSSIFNNEAYIKELDLKFSEPEDFQKIMSFLMYGN